MRYISRTQWGARPPQTRNGAFTALRPWRVAGVVVHHSAVVNGPRGADAVRAFEGHHLRNGWDGIAYNWLVDESGTIYEGRGWEARGGATKGWNAKSISICFTGHGDEQPRDPVLASIQTLVKEAQARFGGKLWVSTHRRKGSTTCPGTWLGSWVEGGTTPPHNPSDADWAGIVAYFQDLKKQVEASPLGRWPRRRRGEAVRMVQSRLADRGFNPGPADGIFGRNTERAVKGFQGSQGFLKVTGVVDGNTFAALFIQ
tara:strand:+ start:4422 stop:5192 length:771 start_codon:yes stop_codon:yes gene_type:complete